MSYGPGARRLRWLPAALLLGITYASVGVGFAIPTTHAQAWRLAAWSVSAVGYGAHIAFERYRLRNRPSVAALHVAVAVALGAFGLAAGANIRSLSSGAMEHRLLLRLSLVIWPIMTAVPAYLVAWAASAVLASAGRKPRE